MKCDELEEWYAGQFSPSARVYGALDVTEAIAELKAKLDKAIAERDGNQVCIDALKQKLENVQASMYCDVVDANMEIRRLKEERRWRKCSEQMPSADEGYFIVLWEDKSPDIGYIGAEDDVIETIRYRGEGHSVEWWMPLPSAPKEADK